MRLCVFTVLTGSYERLLEQPVAAESSVDFLCFTDAPELESTTWTVRPFVSPLPADPMRSSRLPKIMAHEFVSEYDVSIYIDNSVLLRKTPEIIVNRLLSADCDMVAMRHSYRETVAAEFQAVLDFKLDYPDTVLEQLEHYRAIPAAGLDLVPLWNAVLVRRHNEPSVRAAMTAWWTQVLRYSRRDQLSVRLATTDLGNRLREIELDNHESDLHLWPVGDSRDISGRFISRESTESMLATITMKDRLVAELASQVDELRDAINRSATREQELHTEIAQQRENLRLQQRKTKAVLGSRTWKVGRTITAPARVTRGLRGRSRPRD